MRERITDRQFVCHLHWNGLAHWSLGVHVHLLSPNVELHFPGGFIRIGWQGSYVPAKGPVMIGKRYRPCELTN